VAAVRVLHPVLGLDFETVYHRMTPRELDAIITDLEATLDADDSGGALGDIEV